MGSKNDQQKKNYPIHLCNISAFGLGKLYQLKFISYSIKTAITTINDEFPGDWTGTTREIAIRIDEIRDEVNELLSQYEQE